MSVYPFRKVQQEVKPKNRIPCNDNALGRKGSEVKKEQEGREVGNEGTGGGDSVLLGILELLVFCIFCFLSAR